jgi:tripartite-type tricarboxylate transporter receptor subunit TctC
MKAMLPRVMAALAAMLPLGESANAQEFPTKTVRIVASEAGGGGDFIARLLAQGLTPTFGQQVIVENRGGGVVAGDVVARSAPDGYTLLLYANTLWILPLMRKQVPYDPHRDFAPVTLVGRAGNVLSVHPSMPVKSVKELIALAMARPGQINFSTAAPGTSNHLAGELFNSMAKINLVRISYRGAASAFNALMSGEVQMMFATMATAHTHIKAGRVRPLGVTTKARSPVYPDLPTIAEAALPGFEAVSIYGLFAPAKTPDATLLRLQQEVTRLVLRTDSRERMASIGTDPVGSTREELAAEVKSEVARMGKVIREAGIYER